MLRIRLLFPSVCLCLSLSLITVANDHSREADHDAFGEIAYSPTKELIVSLFDNNQNWGFVVVLSSKSQNEQRVAPSMRIEESYSSLVDTSLLKENRKYFFPIRKQRFIITIDSKELRLRNVSIDKHTIASAWAGETKFRLFKLEPANYTMEIHKINARAECDFRGHQHFVTEGKVELVMAEGNRYHASLCLAGCTPLSTGYKCAGEHKCITEFVRHRRGSLGSEFNEVIQITWGKW
jgi:hypothetical protein